MSLAGIRYLANLGNPDAARHDVRERGLDVDSGSIDWIGPAVFCLTWFFVVTSAVMVIAAVVFPSIGGREVWMQRPVSERLRPRYSFRHCSRGQAVRAEALPSPHT